MVSRENILSKAIDDCIKDIYSIAQPQVNWEDFKEQCKEYSKNYLEWEKYRREKIQKPEWKGKNITECIGPRPYEFYYVPNTIQKEIADSYIYAYRIDAQQELLNTIEILKNYCKEPIVDKWIEGEGDSPGHRGYDHPDNLEKELTTLIKMYCDDSEADFIGVAKEVQSKFFEFLDMAGEFYNWNSELNSFNMSVFLGITPNTNKQKVIDNWKQYRNKDIEIDESKFEEEDE